MARKSKEPSSFIYKSFRPLVKVIFKIVYKPIILNKEYLKQSGPIIVCGNHIHVMDQMWPITNSKRMLHYMAKKEYFEGKFAWFFKASGCIRVDRSIHDADAKEKAMDILNNNLGLGIFPEGTRNRVSCKEDWLNKLYKLYENEYSKEDFKKMMIQNNVSVSGIMLLDELKKAKKITNEEYKKYILNPLESLKGLLKKKVITKDEFKESLMLPLKYGTASMAIKSGATICPYVLTGNYKKFSGYVKCEFLKPIKTNKNDDVVKVTELLRKEMLDALYKEII